MSSDWKNMFEIITEKINKVDNEIKDDYLKNLKKIIEEKKNEIKKNIEKLTESVNKISENLNNENIIDLNF